LDASSHRIGSLFLRLKLDLNFKMGLVWLFYSPNIVFLLQRRDLDLQLEVALP
jgi:hypothetical protein